MCRVSMTRKKKNEDRVEDRVGRCRMQKRRKRKEMSARAAPVSLSSPNRAMT
jgi:hypothetical protein